MTTDLKESVLGAVSAQIQDLEPRIAKQVDIVALGAALDRLAAVLAKLPQDQTVQQLELLVAGDAQKTKDIRAGKGDLADFGAVLVDVIRKRAMERS